MPVSAIALNHVHDFIEQLRDGHVRNPATDEGIEYRADRSERRFVIAVKGGSKAFKLNPHTSHNMTEWELSIVALSQATRFGRMRRCKRCRAEQRPFQSAGKYHGGVIV
ncbi:MAG TPA: hypothetical protein VIN40_02455 [Candidatus Tyrphobacter sp.]